MGREIGGRMEGLHSVCKTVPVKTTYAMFVSWLRSEGKER